jgi:hypothetical protein
MKYIHPFLSVFLMVNVLALNYAANAISEDNTCYLKAKTANLHVSVYEFLPAGTIGKQILKGVLKKDQQILLKSKYGKIYYEYSTEPEGHSSMAMGFIRSCKEKEIFLLP